MHTEFVSQNSFRGHFCCPEKLKSKQAKFLKEILASSYNGVSADNFVKTMPFDVEVFCINPSKRAINPRFNFWITHTKNYATLQGNIIISSKDSLEHNLSKLNNFMKNFKEKLDKIKGNEKLTPREELQRQVDFILFGKYKSYFD